MEGSEDYTAVETSTSNMHSNITCAHTQRQTHTHKHSLTHSEQELYYTKAYRKTTLHGVQLCVFMTHLVLTLFTFMQQSQSLTHISQVSTSHNCTASRAPETDSTTFLRAERALFPKAVSLPILASSPSPALCVCCACVLIHICSYFRVVDARARKAGSTVLVTVSMSQHRRELCQR